MNTEDTSKAGFGNSDYKFQGYIYLGEFRTESQINPAIKMIVIENDAPLRTAPYQVGAVFKRLALNQELTVVGYCINMYGNKWYKTDTGHWIYDERVSNKAVTTITMHPTKGSNVSTNKKVTGGLPDQIVEVDNSITIIGPAPKLEGYTFMGYATKENAKTAQYQIGSKIEKVPEGGINLYPVWKQEKVTMSLSCCSVSLDATNSLSHSNETVRVEVSGNLNKSKGKVEAVSDHPEIATVTVSDNSFDNHAILKDILTAKLNINALFPGKANVIVSVNDKDGKAIARQTVSIKVDRKYDVTLWDDTGSIVFAKYAKSHDNNLVLSSAIPEKAGNYSFMGWAATTGASMPEYGPGDIYKENAPIDLYPVWIANHGITKPTFENGVLTINGRGNMPSYPTGKTEWNQYKDQTTKIVIDPEITSIGSNAFAGFNKVTEVVIPYGVQYIGCNAFNSTALTRVVIPSSVRKIGNRAFANCTKLVDSAFADTIAGSRSKSSQAFSENSSLEIGAFAFENCVSLASIDLPDTVTELGTGAFNGCTNLESVELSDNLTIVEDSTFFGCSSLTEIEIPEGVTEIGDGAFNGCSAMPAIELPDDLDSLGDQVFAGCSAMETVVIPEGIDDYGAGIFANCSALTNVDLPEDMEQIPDAMFTGCSAMKTIELPESIETIGSSAFRNCAALEGIELSENISLISSDAFNGCSAMESVVVPASVTVIGDFAFSESGLKEIEVNEGLTTIGTGAFAFCEELESFSVPASVTAIEDGAFMGCSALREVELLESTVAIGDDVFMDCSSLNMIELPEGIASLGENVFSGCADSLTVVCFCTSSVYDQVVDTCDNVDTIYPVTGVSLDKTTAAMHAGDALQLQPIIVPANATDPSVVWTTNHPEIASVDENGLVTTSDGGTVVITATTNDNKLVAQCEITVTVPVENIDLSEHETTAYVDDSFQLGYAFEPANPTNIGVSWSTSDEKVATVNEGGEVTIVGTGVATVTATTEDGGYTSSCVINAEAYVDVEEIVLDPSEITLQVGDTQKINASVLPTNATDPFVSFILSEEAEEIIELDEYGTITALKPGTAELTATAGGVEGKTCTVTVVPKTYSVTWIVDDAKTIHEYEPGAPIQKPDDPVKEGFVFKGWTPEVPETMPANDLTFTAVFEKITPVVYTLTYDANDGSGAPPAQTGNGTITLSSTKPTREGYAFLGWSTDKSASAASFTAGQIFELTSDTTLYAIWKQDPPIPPTEYTLTYDANEGNGAPPAQKGNGAITLSGTKPTREGYAFLGWATSKDAATAQYQPGAVFNLTEDTTLYAVWQKDDTPPVEQNPSVRIKNYVATKSVDYKTTITFTAITTDAPEDAIIHWFIDGKDVGTGETYKKEKATADYTVQCKLIGNDGTVLAESEVETIKVSTGFFAKLIAFFKGLFGSLPVITQAIKETL